MYRYLFIYLICSKKEKKKKTSLLCGVLLTHSRNLMILVLWQSVLEVWFTFYGGIWLPFYFCKSRLFWTFLGNCGLYDWLYHFFFYKSFLILRSTFRHTYFSFTSDLYHFDSCLYFIYKRTEVNGIIYKRSIFYPSTNLLKWFLYSPFISVLATIVTIGNHFTFNLDITLWSCVDNLIDFSIFDFYGWLLFQPLVGLEKTERPPTHFTVFIKRLRNILIHIWMVYCFSFKCVLGPVLTSIVEINNDVYNLCCVPRKLPIHLNFFTVYMCDLMFRRYFSHLLTKYVAKLT